MKNRTLFSRDEMLEMNIQTLKERTVSVEEIAEIAFRQQKKWTDDISLKDCIDSVEKILSLRDVFHLVQLGAEIDRLTEVKAFKGPILDILEQDLGMFGIDELFGLELAGLYGTIGKTNFGDIDVNKPLAVARLNGDGAVDPASLDAARGYALIIKKRYGLFQTPTNAFDASDRMTGSNGSLLYTITNS